MPAKNHVEDDDSIGEAVPLVIPSSYFQLERSSSENDSNVTDAKKRRKVRFRCLMIGITFMMMMILHTKRGSKVLDVDDVNNNNNNNSKRKKNKKATTIKQPKLTVESLQILQQQFNTAQDEFNDLLKIQYGTYYNDIFLMSSVAMNSDGTGTTTMTTTRGSMLFESGDGKSTLSKLRLQRKLSMKVLEASSYGYSSGSSSSASSSIDNNSTIPMTKDVNFIWATGGHSSSAGHGNFHNESYTAYIQYALTNIFDSVNLKFSTRPYGMGGTSSGSEVAFCTKEIYGIDYDVLVYDFGMTDQGNFWKQAMYNYRANLSPYHNPVHLTFNVGARREGSRYDVVQMMEDMGLGILVSSDEVMNNAERSIPDSFGLYDVEIEVLPEYVRNYRCGNGLEKGDPYCDRDKFRLNQCPDRRFRDFWHPGWKWHALMGYLVSHYMIAVLNDALQELAVKLSTGIDAVAIYKELQVEAEQDYDTFWSAPIPKVIQKELPPHGVDGFNLTQFMKGHNYCHTARIPAEIRYLGLLTETTTQLGLANYDKGIGIDELVSGRYVSNNTIMLLSYSEGDRSPCPISTIIDYKDYFYIGAKTGWQQLTLPNHAEREYYYNHDHDRNFVKKHESSSSQPLNGYVALCMAPCNNRADCPEGVFSNKGFSEQGYIQIRINDEKATEMVWMDDCQILRHSTGFRFPVNELDNTVTIEVQIIVPDTEMANSYTRISSWIVW